MEISVKIHPDENGLTGRECPSCEKYFKIKFGTGLPDATDCHCPYCNNVSPQDNYWTKNQIEYAKSVALNKITGDFLRDLKKLERKTDPRAFISIGISVKGTPIPIIYYSENELEQRIVCEKCSLEYAIYGAFGYCPDCGTHNSLQILKANFNLIEKMLVLAEKEEKEVKDKLVENCLEDLISSFDGFGREKFKEVPSIQSFQNLESAKDKILKEAKFDISSSFSESDWKFITTQFQKRHLLAHKMGIIDEEYIRKTGEEENMIGRKVVIGKEDVIALIGNLRTLGEIIYDI